MLGITIEILFIEARLARQEISWDAAEPLLTVVGYNAMTELGWISAIISRETDDY